MIHTNSVSGWTIMYLPWLFSGRGTYFHRISPIVDYCSHVCNHFNNIFSDQCNRKPGTGTQIENTGFVYNNFLFLI